MSARGKEDTEFFYFQGYRKSTALESMGGFKSKSTNNVASHKVTLDLRSKGNFEEDEQTSNTLLHSAAWTLSQAQRFVFVAQSKLVERRGETRTPARHAPTKWRVSPMSVAHGFATPCVGVALLSK